MCLQYKHTLKERKEVTDQIGKEGLKVYKVVAERIEDKEYLPPFSLLDTLVSYAIRKKSYKEGLNEADIKGWVCNFPIPTIKKKHLYRKGFHFYKQPAAAQNSADHLNKLCKVSEGYVFKVVTCTVKKSWITMIGREWGIRDGVYKFGEREFAETVIVAKKAIFPKRDKNDI